MKAKLWIFFNIHRKKKVEILHQILWSKFKTYDFSLVTFTYCLSICKDTCLPLFAFSNLTLFKTLSHNWIRRSSVRNYWCLVTILMNSGSHTKATLSAPNVITLTKKTSPDLDLSKLKFFSILGTRGPHVLVVGGGHDQPKVVRRWTRVSPVDSQQCLFLGFD